MAKPVVDGLERKWQGKLEVAHVDANDDASSEITKKYGVSALPAFVFPSAVFFSRDRTPERDETGSALFPTTCEAPKASDPTGAGLLLACVGACPSRRIAGIAKATANIPANATPHTKDPTATGRVDAR